MLNYRTNTEDSSTLWLSYGRWGQGWIIPTEALEQNNNTSRKVIICKVEIVSDLTQVGWNFLNLHVNQAVHNFFFSFR